MTEPTSPNPTESLSDGSAPAKPAPLVPASIALPPELQNLPGDAKAEIFSMIASISLRNLTGPDPETARIAAQSEMHEETCRLDGYKKNLEVRDKQNERDHVFRTKKLNHQTALNLIFYALCVAGIAVGLYLYTAKGEKTVGSNVITACFVALLGGKALLPKEKE
jgi:phosphotransferase system  glucose/maltose/N-acetylglucosamine-specific IIC component